LLFCAVQASIPSNTYVITGASEHKRVEQMLPGIMSQLGPESMDYIRSFAEMMSKAGAGGMPAVNEGEEGEEEDEDQVPDLVENFEEAAAK
jgi:nascent polypeptide-associated complex subunit beta